MAFEFEWARLRQKDVVDRLLTQLNQSLGADKDVRSVGSMHVTSLDFGSLAPDLEIVGLNALAEGSAQVTFAFRFEGNASITFYTLVECNCITSSLGGVGTRGRYHMGMANSHISLPAPIHVSLSQFKLEGKVVVRYDDRKITVTLKNDAFQDVKVNSSFDGSSVADTVADTIKSKISSAFANLVDSPKEIEL